MGCSERKMTAGLLKDNNAVLHIDCLKGAFEDLGAGTSAYLQQQQQCRNKRPPGPAPDYSNVPFPLKLHAMLDDAARHGFDHIVSWECDGRAFMVHDIDGFVNRVLHQYFNQTRYKSFQRQLNIYGFQRVARGREKGMCFHSLFVRGQPQLCIAMQRNKIKDSETRAAMASSSVKAQAVLSSKSSAAAALSSDSSSDDSSQEGTADSSSAFSKEDETFDIMASFEGKTFYLVGEHQDYLSDTTSSTTNFGSSFFLKPQQKVTRKTPEADAPHIRPHNNCRNDSFPWKLYDMLEEVTSSTQSHIVSWENDGKALKVHKPDEFGKIILPAFFLHTKKWESFQRQLNLYGFTRIARGPNKGMYHHPHFIRGQRSLCRQITRPR